MDELRIDSHKVMYHPERIAKWLRAEEGWPSARGVYPIYVELSPVGACNHRCTFCAVDYLGYKPNVLDEGIFARRFEEMARLGVRSVMFAGEGEPLIHKRFGALAASAKWAGLDLALTSNGTLMGEKFVEESLQDFSWIKVSCNAGSAEGYSAIHRTKARDFEKVLGNVRRAAAIKRSREWNVAVGMQLVLLPENEHEVLSLARRCRDEVRPDYLVIKPYSQHLSSETRRYEDIVYDGYEPLREELLAIADDDFRIVFRANTMRKLTQEREYTQCQATPYFWAYVMSTGDAYACSAFLGHERFNLGNLHESSFQEIWGGQRRKSCAEFVSQELDIASCRTNCRMDEVNRFLWDVKHPPRHANFI